MSCACGKLDKRIPRESGAYDTEGFMAHSPKDKQLKDYGFLFLEEIRTGNYYKASVMLHLIETRGNDILRELEPKTYNALPHRIRLKKLTLIQLETLDRYYRPSDKCTSNGMN